MSTQFTPFKYLKLNINKIKFDCKPEYIPEYKLAFSRMLDRLDKYFTENKLYDCGDYQSYVEEMIKPNSTFSFKIDDEIKKLGFGGAHIRALNGERIIDITQDNLGKGTQTEGILCHEFFHYLTLGPKRLKYEKDGKRIEIEFSIPKGQSKEYVWNPGNSSPSPDTSYITPSVEAMNGDFICEAMTELTKQKIYSTAESSPAYTPLTQMMSFVSNMVGADISTREFLQGNLKSFYSAMQNTFPQFIDCCDEFYKKFKLNAHIDYKRDKSYIAIQDTFVKNYLPLLDQQLNTQKLKPSRVAKILATLYSAPIANRQYDAMILSLKSHLTVRQNLPTEQRKMFSQLLNKTISECALRDANLFALPNDAPNVIFKKENNDVAISFNSSPYILLRDLPKSTNTSTTIQRHDGSDIVQTTFKLTDQGFYEITDKNNRTGETQTVNLMFDAKNPDNVLISDKAKGTKYQIAINRTKVAREANIEENLNLLDNSQHLATVQNIISAMPAKSHFDIKKVMSNDGHEYLIATLKDKTMFVKVDGNEYKLVNVVSESKLPNMQVCDKIRSGENDTGMIGYLPTNLSTDEDSIAYKLADGTTFVQYWNPTKLTYGEQVTPFANSPETRVISTKNEVLYSSSNKSLDSVFEKPTATKTSVNNSATASTSTTNNTSFNFHIIKRELKAKDVNAEKEALEESQRKKAEEQRKQQEIEKRREEEKQQKKLSNEEIARRDKKLEEERQQRAQKDEALKQKYNELQKHISSQQKIYDEFGIDITDIVNRQQSQGKNISYGRNR